MNSKQLTLKDLNIKDELIFIKYYYKYLLSYCQEYDLQYDGLLAVEIIKLGEFIDRITSDENAVIKDKDMKYLIKIAEGRVFKQIDELSSMYNRKNTHDILKIPRYKMYHILERHGF